MKKFAAYESDLAACKSINELVWVYTDMAKDMTISAAALNDLIKIYRALRTNMEKNGDRYTRATRPAFRK